ncbi:MAG TPA: radical SAM protein [Thermomicrobiales bacterium]|nr:radical SAM protein [Thermomicrobiales bacterium]
MDILLTHGYCMYEDPHEMEVRKPYPPLGILYISAHLKAHGFDTKVFDMTFKSLDAFAEYVKRERPPVVGIYCNLMTRPRIIKMIKHCKEAGSLVVAGGPDSANWSEEYLERGADVVVIGEGELTLEELLPHLARYGPNNMEHILGIVYRDGDGNIVRTPERPYIDDLTAQPFPDRAAIDIPEYVRVWKDNHGMGSVSLITARGCPYTCKWCSHAVYGYTHRRRSPENVADELQLIIDTYNPDMVWYADDVFTIHRGWFLKYVEELKKRGIKIPFETISREDRLKEEIVAGLAEIGCFRIWVGAESGSQRILDSMKRKTNAEGVIEVTHRLQRHGIEAGMFIMLGYDGEEMEDLEASVDLLKRSNPDVFLTTVAYPIKGTPYYKDVADRVIALKSWEEGSDRDFTVAGRHSRRFYEHATRWMVNEVKLHKQRQSPDRDPVALAKAAINVQRGRAGMLLTQHEVESGQ